MNDSIRIFQGVVHGRTIELDGDPGPLEGQQVEVLVRRGGTEAAWGEGILRSAGGWANYPEIDEVLEQLHRERRGERRNEGL